MSGQVRDGAVVGRTGHPLTFPDSFPSVARAVVRVLGTSIRTYTDAQGRFRIPEASIAKTVPDAITVSVSASGFGRWTLRGIRCDERGSGPELTVLLTHESSDTHVPSDPRESPSTAQPAGTRGDTDSSCGPDYNSETVAPPSVRVWMADVNGYTGTPQEVIVPFETYVEETLGPEWGPDDAAAALAAGAMAVKSYAWYFILTHEKPSIYAPAGACYDVDNSDNFQDFDPAHPVYQDVEDAVSSTWPNVMASQGDIFEASFVAGTPGESCSVNAGSGQMLQDGSETCADDGLTWQEILDNYYSDHPGLTISAATASAETDDVFVRSGSGGQLDAYKYDTSTGARAAQDWTAASKGGVAMTGDPDIIVDGSNIDAFVESATKGQLDEYQFNTTTSAWSAAEDWTAATKGGVPMTGTPHAVVNGDTIDVFVQSATDGQLDEYQYNTTNGDRDAQDWTAATKGGVPMTGDPDVIVNGSDIDAFVQSATKGQLDEYQYNTTNGDRDAQDWTAATKGGVPMTGDPDVIVNGSDIDAFVQSATKGQLDEYQYNTTNGDRDAQDWTAATKGGVPMTGDPDVIVNGSDIDAFVQSATDGQLDEYQYNTTNGDRDAQDWTAATKGGVPMTGNPSAVVAGQDIDTFVQSATDGQLDEYQYNTTNGDRDAQDWTAATKGGVPMTGDPAANTY